MNINKKLLALLKVISLNFLKNALIKGGTC